jgi:RNA polymerase sigma-70 factor
LYLACACLARNSNALRHLETMCRSELAFALRRLRTSVDEDDVIAALMEKLLVAKPGSVPRLGRYSGRSELRRWIQVVVVRHVLDEKRLFSIHKQLQGEMVAGILSSGIPNWREMDPATRTRFKDALGRALESLSDRDRNVLRLRLNGLTTAEIAALFNVNRFTVSRWLGSIGALVEHAVRRELQEGLRLGSQEIDSLVRSVLSGVDTSIRRNVSQACGEE